MVYQNQKNGLLQMKLMVCSASHSKHIYIYIYKLKKQNIFLDLGIFHIGKRLGYFVHWEPIYIGTNADPPYDERLSWEGKSDKMTQVTLNNFLKFYKIFSKFSFFITGIRLVCFRL